MFTERKTRVRRKDFGQEPRRAQFILSYVPQGCSSLTNNDNPAKKIPKQRTFQQSLHSLGRLSNRIRFVLLRVHRRSHVIDVFQTKELRYYNTAET